MSSPPNQPSPASDHVTSMLLDQHTAVEHTTGRVDLEKVIKTHAIVYFTSHFFIPFTIIALDIHY